MKLLKNDTVIVTLLTLALFSFVKSLEASPVYLTSDMPQPVTSSGALVEHAEADLRMGFSNGPMGR